MLQEKLQNIKQSIINLKRQGCSKEDILSAIRQGIVDDVKSLDAMILHVEVIFLQR